jgi:hypothetical protein
MHIYIYSESRNRRNAVIEETLRVDVLKQALRCRQHGPVDVLKQAPQHVHVDVLDGRKHGPQYVHVDVLDGRKHGPQHVHMDVLDAGTPGSRSGPSPAPGPEVENLSTS